MTFRDKRMRKTLKKKYFSILQEFAHYLKTQFYHSGT